MALRGNRLRGSSGSCPRSDRTQSDTSGGRLPALELRDRSHRSVGRPHLQGGHRQAGLACCLVRGGREPVSVIGLFLSTGHLSGRADHTLGNHSLGAQSESSQEHFRQGPIADHDHSRVRSRGDHAPVDGGSGYPHAEYPVDTGDDGPGIQLLWSGLRLGTTRPAPIGYGSHGSDRFHLPLRGNHHRRFLVP